MATGASTSRMQLSYVKESTFGTLETGSNLQILRHTSESLRQESDSQVSAEIRSDRQAADVVRTRLRALGDVNVELNYGDYDDLFAAALMDDAWSSVVTVGPATTLSTSDTDNSFNDSDSGFGSIEANQWIHVAGFTTAANNGYFKVVSATAAKLIVSGGTLATEVAGDSVTIKMGAEIVNGTTLASYNIEKKFADLTNVYAILTGMCIDQLSLNIAADAIITGSFGFIGKDSQSAAASSGNGYDAVGTNDVMSAVDNLTAVLENDAAYDMTAVSLNLRNNLRERIEAGTLGTLELGVGMLNISGTLQAYFATSTVMDKFLDFTSSSISVVVEDADGNGYVIDLPKVKYTSGQRVAGGQNQDIIADMAFEAYREPTEGVTIRIARFPAA